MKIETGLYMLKICVKLGEKTEVIYPTVIEDNDSVILIDTGFPNGLDKIKEAFKMEGIPFSKLKTIILTHHDIDHIGSALSIKKEKNRGVKILSYGEEKDYIEGIKTPLKLAQLQKNLEHLPENMKMFYDSMKKGFEMCRVLVDETLKDGEVLPYLGGIVVIHTPGHTKGHISLYIKKLKLLIAGDILGIKEGKLVSADKNLNFDNELNKKSLKKLTAYDIEKIICYHGGFYEGDINNIIKNLSDVK